MRNLPAMIDFKDIKDRESLEAWLEALPQETEEDRAERRRIALTIAWQAAACGLPTYWRWVRENTNFESAAKVALPFLRSIVVANYASSCDKAHFRIARELAVTTAGEAERVAKIITRAESPEIISKAGFAAVYAADAVSMGVKVKAVVTVAESAGLFESEFPNQISFHDVLLSSDYKGVVEDWAWIKNDLKNHDSEQALATDWAFWIWWYDGLLNGTAPAPDSQMMQDVALLPDEVWQDVDTANARINEIWKLHELRHEADQRLEDLRRSRSRDVQSASVAVRNHNNPPELVDDATVIQLKSGIEADLKEAVEELSKPEPEKDRLARIGRGLVSALQKMTLYICNKFDVALNEGFKSAGKAGGVATATVGADFLSNGKLMEFAEKLIQFATG